MSQSLKVCEVQDEVKARLKKFRFRKETNRAAIVLKIDKSSMMVVIDEEYEDMDGLDDLQEEIPDHEPRYVLYSTVKEHNDGRKSYPLCFIFVTPIGGRPESQMMYAGSRNGVVQDIEVTKVFELRGKDELTEEWMQDQLAFFK